MVGFRIIYEVGISFLSLFDDDAHASVVLRHGHKHVIIVCYILIGGVAETHVGNDAESEASEAEMQFSEGEAVRNLAYLRKD